MVVDVLHIKGDDQLYSQAMDATKGTKGGIIIGDDTAYVTNGASYATERDKIETGQPKEIHVTITPITEA